MIKENCIHSVKLKAVRAIDDRERSLKFLDGHEKVLSSIGVKRVTSLNDAWMYNEDVYLFVVESAEDDRILGGGRIHLHNANYKLPIQEAIEKLDDRIISYIEDKHVNGRVGELCGLWNSREVAGYGFGSHYLSRAGISILDQIGCSNLIALCASYTVPMGMELGYRIEKNLGNDGTFNYPKLDLIATVMILEDCLALSNTPPYERSEILSLRSEPQQLKVQTLKKKEIEIQYDLNI